MVAKGSFAGVYASLSEIMRVHETHPDFRISVSQQSVEEMGPQSSYEQDETPQDTVKRRGGLQAHANVEANPEFHNSWSQKVKASEHN